jgi:hypothetical protein
MSRQKMLAAREPIKEKRYPEAHAILKTIDHPTAREWLAKLDEIAPEKKRLSLSTVPYTYIIGFGVLSVLIVIAVALILNRWPSSILTETFSYSGVIFRYPRGWQVSTGTYQITLSSPVDVGLAEAANTTPAHQVIITVTREANPDKSPLIMAEEARNSLLEGYTDFEGNVVRESITTDPPKPVSFGNYSGVSLNFALDGISATNIILDTGNRTITTFTGISNDPAYLDPVLTEITRSFSFDPSLAGDFACPIASWWENTAGSYITRFLDTTEVAASTSRIAVSPLVLEMQRIYREFEALEYPPCAAAIRNKLIDAMEAAVDGMTSFVGRSDILAGIYLDQSAEDFRATRDMLWDRGFFGADIRLGIADTLW